MGGVQGERTRRRLSPSDSPGTRERKSCQPKHRAGVECSIQRHGMRQDSRTSASPRKGLVRARFPYSLMELWHKNN